MVTLTCFPRYKSKWFGDEFNSQSQILQDLGDINQNETNGYINYNGEDKWGY